MEICSCVYLHILDFLNSNTAAPHAQDSMSFPESSYSDTLLTLCYRKLLKKRLSPVIKSMQAVKSWFFFLCQLVSILDFIEYFVKKKKKGKKMVHQQVTKSNANFVNSWYECAFQVTK